MNGCRRAVITDCQLLYDYSIDNNRDRASNYEGVFFSVHTSLTSFSLAGFTSAHNADAEMFIRRSYWLSLLHIFIMATMRIFIENL